jgi:ketosteroid isomerase-like protein
MKTKIILLAMLLCLSMTVAAQNEKQGAVKSRSNIQNNRMSIEKTLIDGEKTAWKNLVDKKYDDFARMLADDYQGFYDSGAVTKEAELAEIRKTNFKSAEVSGIRVQWVDENTAIVTAAVKSDYVGPDGKEINETARTTSVFAKRGNAWLCVFHSDALFNPKEYTVE